MSENIAPKKKGFRIPEATVLLFVFIFVAALLTWVVPANKYDPDPESADARLILPDTYHSVDRNPQGLWAVMQKIPVGFRNGAQIIFFTMFIVGAFSIITATGTIEAVLRKIIIALNGKDFLIIFVAVTVFGLIGAGFGVMEVGLVFVPMLITMSLTLGYDSLVGIAIPIVAANTGAAGGFIQSILAIAQRLVGLPVFSGMAYRIVEFIVYEVTVMLFIYFYGQGIKKNPQKSSTYESDKTLRRIDLNAENVPMTGRQKITGIVMLLGFLSVILGVVKWGWGLDQLAAVFLSMGILAGIICRIDGEQIVSIFVEGVAPILPGLIAIGLGQTVLQILDAGNILHTIVHAMSTIVINMPNFLQVIGMYLVQLFISVVVPSGTGMAMVTMPIMGPLATTLGMTQQTAIVVFQVADAITNIIIPTSGFLMAALAMAKVPYEKWFVWYGKLFLILTAEGAIFGIIADIIKLGPF